MSNQSFSILKEIDSLIKMRIHQLKAKGEQEGRLTNLNERRQTTILQTNALKEKLVQNHQKMGDVDSKMKVASEQRDRIRGRGGDEDKVRKYSLELDHLEEEGLLLLSEAEEVENQIKDLKTFLIGVEQTIQEIQGEVIVEINKFNKEIDNIDLRLKLLQDELPQDFQSLYQRISSKNPAHGPFTRIDNGSCYFCRFKISRIEESEIDIHKNLKTCPQCSRIFLPYGL